MSFYKDEITIDLSEDYTSDWIYLDTYKSLIDELTINSRHKNVTGTTDGTIEVHQLFGDDLEEGYDVLHTFEINSPNGRNAIKTSVDCLAVRFKYNKNNVTGGNAILSLILAGKY